MVIVTGWRVVPKYLDVFGILLSAKDTACSHHSAWQNVWLPGRGIVFFPWNIIGGLETQGGSTPWIVANQHLPAEVAHLYCHIWTIKKSTSKTPIPLTRKRPTFPTQHPQHPTQISPTTWCPLYCNHKPSPSRTSRARPRAVRPAQGSLRHPLRSPPWHEPTPRASAFLWPQPFEKPCWIQRPPGWINR